MGGVGTAGGGGGVGRARGVVGGSTRRSPQPTAPSTLNPAPCARLRLGDTGVAHQQAIDVATQASAALEGAFAASEQLQDEAPFDEVVTVDGGSLRGACEGWLGLGGALWGWDGTAHRLGRRVPLPPPAAPSQPIPPLPPTKERASRPSTSDPAATSSIARRSSTETAPAPVFHSSPRRVTRSATRAEWKTPETAPEGRGGMACSG